MFYYRNLSPLLLCLIACLLVKQACAASCSIQNVNTVNFGQYDVFSQTANTATGRVRVQCSPGTTPYTIALDGGLSGNVSNRKLTGGTDTPINYNLYTEPSNSIIWGNGTGGGVVMNGQGNTNYTIYGKIDPGQDARVGSYQDTVLVTVAF